MLAMLKAGGPPPRANGRISPCSSRSATYKARHASTMLTFDAVVDALGQIARKPRGRRIRRRDAVNALGRAARAARMR